MPGVIAAALLLGILIGIAIERAGVPRYFVKKEPAPPEETPTTQDT